MRKKFIRADSFRYSRIGKNRPKLQKWRRPRGKHNKLRLKRAGHSKQPGIGYRKSRKQTGKIKNLLPVLVHNVKDLQELKKANIVILARVGMKKKFEIIKEAEKLGITIFNFGGRKNES